MMKILRKPVDCYRHPIRYKALITLHVINAITFIIRFSLICVDLSKSQEIPTNVIYPVIIFFLELMSTLPFFISNILYCVLCCFKKERFHDTHCCSRNAVFRIATLTCCPCQCYEEHPQGVQFTRVAILMLSFIIHFIAFILGASCATTFNPRCVPYTVISSFALVPSFLTLIIEWLHFHLLWNFQPNLGKKLAERLDRSHLRFIPEKLANDAKARGWSTSLCKNNEQCSSNSLNHTILYHTSRAPRLQNNKRIIAYHITTIDRAVKIAENGFPTDQRRQVDDNIYFMRTVDGFHNSNATDRKATICVRLSLGKVLEVSNDPELSFNAKRNQPDLPQTLELKASGKIKVRFPGQIENWVIVSHTGDIEDFDPSYYDGCV